VDADFAKLNNIMGEPVIDREGTVIGKVAQVAYEPNTLRPEWLVLKTSRFGRQQRLVPLGPAVDDGGTVRVPFSKDTVLSAPVPAIPTTPALTEATALQEHYRAA
jgi:sporulation protein YlmC with PRC-barrel domain